MCSENATGTVPFFARLTPLSTTKITYRFKHSQLFWATVSTTTKFPIPEFRLLMGIMGRGGSRKREEEGEGGGGGGQRETFRL